MKARGAYLYQDVDLVWFEAEWQAGTNSDIVAAGMRARGYVDFDPIKCRWLAKYRNVGRKKWPGYHAKRKPVPVTVEAVISKRLEQAKPTLIDNRKVDVVRRFPSPVGGYRICR